MHTLINCGSWYENKNNQGIFHFLEHMLFHGTKNFPNTQDLMSFTKDNGIYTNAYTSGEYIDFYLNVPGINLDKAVKIIEETIFYPIFPENKIENEKNVVIQEFKSKWDRPETRFFYQVDQKIFGTDHLYTRDPIGEIDCIKKFISSDLKKIHQKYFQPQNITILISGNIKNQKNIIDQLSLILNQQKNTYLSKVNIPYIKPSSQKKLIYNDKPEQETICINWILRNKRKSTRIERISQTVFNNILGNGIDSILFKTFRIKYGLVYGIKSKITELKNCTVIEISCQIDPSNSQKFLESFDQEFNGIINQITIDKFQQSIKYINYQSLMVYDSLLEISNWLLSEIKNYKKILLPEDYINLSKKTNFQSTFDFFKEKLNPKNRYVFRMTPIKPEQ